MTHVTTAPPLAKLDAYAVYVLDEPLAADAPLADDRLVFTSLPMIALPVGSAAPSAVTVRSTRTYPRAYILWLQAIDWCCTQPVAVLNISLGPSAELPDTETDPDPLAVALATAARMGRHCVVAAGNRYGEDTLSYFARSPWTISVGAVDDDRRLIGNSARGSAAGKPGPTVVANGFADDRTGAFSAPGTSFATPRVAIVYAWLRSFIARIVADVQQVIAGTWEPMEMLTVPVVAYLDTGMTQAAYDAISTAQTKYISRTPQQRLWLQRVLGILSGTYGVQSHLGNSFEVGKHALAAIAQPMPSYQPFEVGAGLIEFDDLEKLVRNLTPENWLRLFGGDAPSIARADLDALNATFGALYESAYADIFIDHFNAGPGKYILRVV